MPPEHTMEMGQTLKATLLRGGGGYSKYGGGGAVTIVNSMKFE